jgi:hypothetical protein
MLCHKYDGLLLPRTNHTLRTARLAPHSSEAFWEL